MGKARHCSSQYLKERVQVLSLVVEMCGIGMYFREIASEKVLLAVQLLVHHVTVHATEEVVFCFDEEVFRSIPWSEGRIFDLMK